MEPNRKSQRRRAGISGLKAVITSASVAALLGGWGLISLNAQAAQAGSPNGSADPTAPPQAVQPDTSANQHVLREHHDFGRGFDDDQDGGFFSGGETFTRPSFNPGQSQGSQLFLPRTRSSR